jgi:hypothetical protein
MCTWFVQQSPVVYQYIFGRHEQAGPSKSQRFMEIPRLQLWDTRYSVSVLEQIGPALQCNCSPFARLAQKGESLEALTSPFSADIISPSAQLSSEGCSVGFAYVTKRSREIATHGTGNPNWDKPMTNLEYEEQRLYKNSDISIEQVSFRDPEQVQQEDSNESGKIR